MGHGFRYQQIVFTFAPCLQLLGMADRDQVVLFPVNEEGRAAEFVHDTQIVELLRD